MTLQTEPLEARQLFAAGSFDASYSGGGTETVPMNRGSGFVSQPQVAVDANGSAYVMATNSTAVQIRRVTRRGILDEQWAQKQLGDISFASPGDNSRSVLHVDAQNRLDVLVGTTLYRFNADGTADSTFGVGGRVTLADFAQTRDFTIDADGKIDIVGSAKTGPRSQRTSVMRVERFLSRGRADRTFGVGGLYTLTTAAAGTLATAATGERIVALPDGTVIAAGQDGGDSGFGGIVAFGIKLTTAGGLDGRYGVHGVSRPLRGEDNDLQRTYVAVAGLRAGGQIDLAIVTNTHTMDDYDDTAAYISATGKTAAASDNTPPGIGDNIVTNLPPTQVLPEADGTALAVVGGGLYALTTGGVFDNTFHNGTAIKPVTAVAANPDGSVLTVGVTADNTLALRHFVPLVGPSATLASASTVTAPFTNGPRIYVNFADADGVDLSTITSDAVRIVSPGHVEYRPTFLGVKPPLAGNTFVTAGFRLTDAGGNSSFSVSDNGVYGIRVVAGTVKDSLGHPVAGGTIGTLTVDIA